MAQVYVENVEKVTTGLYSFSSEVQERLKGLLAQIAFRIGTRWRTSLAGHSRSGRQAASVRAVVKSYGDRLVSASVVVGGTRAVRYAHAFERGFRGQVTVRAHKRADRFDVKSYTARRAMKAHGYGDHALKAEAANAPLLIAQEINTTAKRKGLT